MKIRGLEVGQSPCMSGHRVTEQLCGKHAGISPAENGDKCFDEPFCVLSSIILLQSGGEREHQMEIDDGKVNEFLQGISISLMFKTQWV